MKRNPKKWLPQFLLHNSCTTPYEDYSETEFIRFSSDSLPDDPEWTRLKFHKFIGTNYEKISKKWADSIFAPYLVYYPLRGLFGNRVTFVSAPIHFRTTPNGRECNFINP